MSRLIPIGINSSLASALQKCMFKNPAGRVFRNYSSSSSFSSNNATHSDTNLPIIPVNTSTAEVSYFTHQGRRRYMEDTSVVARVSGPADLVAVFDGHGGAKVSNFLEKHFYPNYVSSLNKHMTNLNHDDLIMSNVIKTALDQAVNDIDAEIIKNPSYDKQGSTASILVISSSNKDSKDKNYITCNIGDSRIVLSRKGKAVELTTDHCPSRADEQARIKKVGGYVVWHGDRDKNGPILDSG